MKQVPIKLGPLALLLTVVSICLTALAILTFSTARADRSLAEKYARTVQTRYELEARAQAYRRDAARDGLSGEPDENGVYWAEFTQDETTLRVGLDAGGGIVSWRQQTAWEEDTGIGKLWGGS